MTHHSTIAAPPVTPEQVAQMEYAVAAWSEFQAEHPSMALFDACGASPLTYSRQELERMAVRHYEVAMLVTDFDGEFWEVVRVFSPTRREATVVRYDGQHDSDPRSIGEYVRDLAIVGGVWASEGVA